MTVTVTILGVLGCNHGDEPDAYGNFETTSVIVSAQTNGQLLRFLPSEGERIDSGVAVALIDTTQIALERQQSSAQRSAATARTREADKQIAALQVQRDIAKRAYDRTQRLFAQQAATSQQLDQVEREYRVLTQQVAAARAQRESAQDELSAAGARTAQMADRLAKSRVINPVSGTVLATYAEAGEVVQPGQPLYKIASLDSLELRAYVTEPQLAHIRLGEQAHVAVDVGSGQRRVLAGTVSWISAEAEFTPTPVQTRDERAELVYAVKITVPNAQGIAKIGMPADVQFDGRIATQ
jgi:HlyD family secretion protein